MIGQVLVDGRPGWRCWTCGSEWQYPPHQDAAEYADAERDWQQAHKGCALVATQLTLEDCNGASQPPDPGVPART